MLDTERVWSLTNAAIEPDWVIAELPHLLARRHHDPHWSRSQGRVVGSEQISLFGLVLAPKRPVHYGALFPEESRDDLRARGAGHRRDQHARRVPRRAISRRWRKAREEEAKLRRAGLVVDEDWHGALVPRSPAAARAQRAGARCLVRASWRRRRRPRWSGRWPTCWSATRATPRASRRISPLGDARLAVHYRFEPGAPDDGMTLDVPLHLLNALDPARLSWLAPGFVADKAAALIQSLPKALRRNFVPAPDFARAFVEAHAAAGADAFAGRARALPAQAHRRRRVGAGFRREPRSSRTCA